MMAWLRRFVTNCKSTEIKRTGHLSDQEFVEAETVVLKLVQREEFTERRKISTGLVVEMDEDQLYHVKTKLTLRESDKIFRFPVLLPSKHLFVEQLIRWYHLKHHHAGTQFLMSKLRERFWIIQSRKTINRVLRRCTNCLRHTGKGFQVDPATLPNSRTEAADAFQTTGVDLAGPLYLKTGEKAWLVLFTCAVFRCVHLDFVISLNTEAFLNALDRFINLRGRPVTIYSDNGSNFVGLVNLFNKLDWSEIELTANVKQIKWIFNPPTAAWWGGWWERLIRTVKDLLKRMLGNARLGYESLRTCLSHVENVINERPLTVMTEDQEDLIPLCPAMFLRGIKSATLPECQELAVDLSAEYKRRMSLQRELTNRFKNEYLSLLVQRAKEKKQNQPSVGDVVLIGADDQKRVHWPLGKIIELIPGRDGSIRTARVKTQKGVLLRPLQRLYPLEVTGSADVQIMLEQFNGPKEKVSQPKLGGGCYVREQNTETIESKNVTRSGRTIHKPKRLEE